MIIKSYYKPDLTNTDILNQKNVLCFNTKNKTINNKDYLEITELGWGFVWLMFKTKLFRNRLFLLITPFLSDSDYNNRIQFFKMKQHDIGR